MPYAANRDLPDNVTRVLPPHAQDIYRAAFNDAWERYAQPQDREGNASREETAHKVAWAAVKQTYEKKAGDAAGRWTQKA